MRPSQPCDETRPASSAASRLSRLRTEMRKAANLAPLAVAGGSAPKRSRNTLGVSIWMSPRGVFSVCPADVAIGSRAPAKADRKT